MNLKTFFESKINLYLDFDNAHLIDGFEVHPVRNVSAADDFLALEQCEEEEADFYSVYAHYIGCGLYCIADLPTKNEATTFCELLERLKTVIAIHP